MKHAFRIRILPLILLLFLAETLFSQTFSLSGKVTDERNRQPLAFVNVVINDGQHGVISDIDGRYAISLDEPILKVKFSSIGYEPKEITLQANQKKCNIALTPKTFELGEVTVEAGENPAHRIIDSLMAHRKANNPNSLGSYRYKLYDKMVFTIDSSSFGQAEANDTIKERNDLKIFDSILKKSDLMVMETASEVLFKKPDRKLQNVLGTKVAGMRDFHLGNGGTHRAGRLALCDFVPSHARQHLQGLARHHDRQQRRLGIAKRESLARRRRQHLFR